MIRNDNEITITEDESKICEICKKVFGSGRLKAWHVRKDHKLNFENYILQVYYNNIPPVCLKTGNELSFKAHQLGPWYCNFSKNNFPRKPHTQESKDKIRDGCEKTSMEKFGVKNVFSTDWCKDKIKKTMLEKYGVENSMHVEEFKQKMLNTFIINLKTRPEKIYDRTASTLRLPSDLEQDFTNKLTSHNIKFESPFVHEGRKYDFYIPDLNSVIEIDGETYHKNTLENLTIRTVNGCQNDYRKNNIIKLTNYKFYRIRYNIGKFVFNDLSTLQKQLEDNKYTPSYGIKYKQVIVEKEYFNRYITKYGKENLKSYAYLLKKFIRTFQPELPYPDLEENLPDILSKLSKMNASKPYNPETKEFSNNISVVGHNYLKHHFHSYWGSKFNGNPSPQEAWLDDKIMQEVIDYRIGCNNSGEIYDFSLHQCVRGLSARRISISFFKPYLAKSIISQITKDNNITSADPIMLDPCCGFGGRLLGFKSLYPNGKYVGYEPNVETYNELLNLIKDGKWENTIEIYNCKFEDFTNPNNHNFDFVFTSIPYYDVEIYSNNAEYTSFDQWKNTFINSIVNCSSKYKNVYINLPLELSNKLEWNDKVTHHIKSNKSHFDKTEGNKLEPIIKLS
jgi:hypothetical protein